MFSYKNHFEHQLKVKPKGAKTKKMKKFNDKGAIKDPERDPKGAKRKPKIKKSIKNHALKHSKLSCFFINCFSFKLVKAVIA